MPHPTAYLLGKGFGIGFFKHDCHILKDDTLIGSAPRHDNSHMLKVSHFSTKGNSDSQA